jgi:hypothetical protein
LPQIVASERFVYGGGDRFIVSTISCKLCNDEMK